MDAFWTEQLNVLVRWLHVLAGVMWIGHLWFFNFVNSQLAKTYDADSKKKVVPELMPRALYFFRWGAAWTWLMGVLLLWLVYWQVPQVLLHEGSSLGLGAGIGVSVGLLLVPFVVYDILWKTPLAKNELTGAIVSIVLVLAVAFGVSRIFTGRALFIHIGAMFGSIMAANVWMRIWPNQRKIIAGIKGTGPAADPSVVATAGLRSKHNTYMSMSLLLFMVSVHVWPSAFGAQAGGMDLNWAVAAVTVLLGFGIAKYLYGKSASGAPAQF
jgi:uncharacterized membrane protein